MWAITESIIDHRSLVLMSSHQSITIGFAMSIVSWEPHHATIDPGTHGCLSKGGH
jgi:hypothetical protein